MAFCNSNRSKTMPPV